MKVNFAHSPHITVCVCVVGLFIVCFSAEARGQNSSSDGAVQYFAPPPLRYIPQDEQTQLATARDQRARTRLGLELAAARLVLAEQSTTVGRYSEAVAQLGIYQALIENTLGFLNQTGQSENRRRDLYRRVEQTLRVHSLRIEAVRRITPAAHALNVQTIIEFTQDARTGALNAFFGGAFVNNN